MASLIAWSDALQSGHPLMDSQHRDLINKINLLLRACDSKQAAETTRMLMRYLETFVADHFAYEERLMQDYHYPQRDSHIDQHVHFRRTFDGIRRQLGTDGPTADVTAGVRSLLIDWFTQHLQIADKALAEFLSIQSGAHVHTV